MSKHFADDADIGASNPNSIEKNDLKNKIERLEMRVEVLENQIQRAFEQIRVLNNRGCGHA